jgi:glycosyltransferase involved in cell wall biosynthesis
MRVALVLTQDRGGPVNLTCELARELAGRPDGPELKLLGPEPATGADDLEPLLVPVHVRSKTDARGGRALGRALRRWAPDVVHAQDRRAALMAASLAGTGAPVVATYHGVPDDGAGLWLREGPLAGRRPSARAAAVLAADALVARRIAVTVAPSAAMARFLRERLRLPGRKVRVIPNGIPQPVVGPPAGPVRTFMSVSVFTAAKATGALVDVFAEVARIRPGLRLILVGDGVERAACQRRAAALGIGDRVEFTGYRPDVPAQLARAEGFVLPSVNENLPVALIQAMGAGLACVASPIGGVPELLDGTTGILVPPGDRAALAAAMARLADDPQLAPALGRAATVAARRFSIAACADAHCALWTGLL